MQNGIVSREIQWLVLLSLSYFFAVANFKGGRYIRIASIFAMGVLETYLSIEAIMPQIW